MSGDVQLNPGPDTGALRISHLNVRSLTSEVSLGLLPSDQKFIKLDEIYKQQILDCKSDVISISETWLDDSIPDSEISLNSFTLFRRDRNRRGGGVLIYVRECLPVRRRVDIESNHSEAIWVEIQSNATKVIIGAYYRPPGATQIGINTFLSELESSVNGAFSCKPECVVIVGDFNDRCDEFYGNHTGSELNNKLVNLAHSHDLHQIISKPTRISSSSVSLSDLIFVDCPAYIAESGTTLPIANSDHHGVYCILKFACARLPLFKRKIYNYSAGNYIAYVNPYHMLLG